MLFSEVRISGADVTAFAAKIAKAQGEDPEQLCFHYESFNYIEFLVISSVLIQAVMKTISKRASLRPAWHMQNH